MTGWSIHAWSAGKFRGKFEENSWFYIYYCKVCKETRSNTVIISQVGINYQWVSGRRLWSTMVWDLLGFTLFVKGRSPPLLWKWVKSSVHWHLCAFMTDRVNKWCFLATHVSSGKEAETVSFLSFRMFHCSDGKKWQSIKTWKAPQVHIFNLMVVHEVYSYSRFEAKHENLALFPNGLSTVIIIFNWTLPSMVPWESGTTLSNSPREISLWYTYVFHFLLTVRI